MKIMGIIAVLFFVVDFSVVQAQTSIPASGSNVTGTGGKVSYTVGQVVYTTNSNSNGSVAQGVQQPFEISVITGLEEAKDISLEVSVYPNPAQEFIKLIIKNYDVQNLRYQLYDINGSILQGDRIESNEIQLSLQNLKPSAYILKVFKGKMEIKAFKIIKN